MPADLAELRRTVLAAFEGVERPPAADIAPHACEECQAVCAAFAEADWRAIPDALLESHESALPLLSPRAYRYFLGAWLLYAIDHFPRREGPAEYLVYDLAPHVPREPESLSTQWHRARLGVLSRAQLDVGTRYLEAVADTPELSRYFGPLTGGRVFRQQMWEGRDESES